MSIRNCLILAAGFGTRMGEIGKSLPKVMWPIFEQRLIELQINYAEKLKCQRIFVNTHCLHQVVESFLRKKYPEVTILHEEEILDVGGAVHNLKRNIEEDSSGETLILNGDVLYLFDELFVEKALAKLSSTRAVLFGVDIGAGYSELRVEDGILREILPKSDKKSLVTYSGMAVVDINQLEEVKGVSKFFTSVADYKNSEVEVITPDNSEYYDFGTSQRYFETCFQILGQMEAMSSRIVKFLVDVGAVDLKKYGKGYGSKSENVINLSESAVESDHQAIIMSENRVQDVDKSGIYFNQIVQSLD